MIKVSVILPVYGVADYIQRCTQSLLDQTLQEMEFLFVDDHGPDNSIQLVEEMIATHPRREQFKILRPEHNLGAGMARNYAIPQAQGEYVAFVDSDDWIEPNMFEELYNEAVAQGNVDLCYCQLVRDYLDGQPSEVRSNPDVTPGLLSHGDRCYFLSHYVSMFCTFIYRRDLIEHYQIRYPESRSADDSFFVTSTLLLADSSAHVDKPFYHYIIRPGSVCTTKDSTKYQKRLATFSSLMAFLKEKGAYDEYRHEIDFIYLKKGYLSSVLNYVANSLEPRKEVIREIHDELLNQVPEYTKNPYFRKKWSLRIIDCMLLHFTWLALKIMPIYIRKTNPMV